MKRLLSMIVSLFVCLLLLTDVSAQSHVFWNHKNSSMKIALTFDDGPHPRYTPEILSILKEYGIKATFFVVGQNVEYYPTAFEQILKDGHEIGNHTYSHPHLGGITRDGVYREIEACRDLIYKKYQYQTMLFRPPEGQISDAVKTASYDLAHPIILWSVDTLDWKNTPSRQIAEHVVDSVKSGDIILMHDYVSHNSPTPEALRLLIPRLLAHGFEFVSVSELIACDP